MLAMEHFAFGVLLHLVQLLLLRFQLRGRVDAGRDIPPPPQMSMGVAFTEHTDFSLLKKQTKSKQKI